jgi:hypothetical protein
MNEQTADIAGPIADADEGWEWAHVELMGHRQHWGRCCEQERFGLKMLRVDIPIGGAPEVKGSESHFYQGTALYGYTPTTMEAVLKANRPYVSAYLAQPRAYEPEPDDPDEDADEQEAAIAAEIEANEPEVPEDDAGPVGWT